METVVIKVGEGEKKKGWKKNGNKDDSRRRPFYAYIPTDFIYKCVLQRDGVVRNNNNTTLCSLRARDINKRVVVETPPAIDCRAQQQQQKKVLKERNLRENLFIRSASAGASVGAGRGGESRTTF
jgi:hypothetical protein